MRDKIIEQAHFSPIFHFYTPWKCQETLIKNFLKVTLEPFANTQETCIGLMVETT